MTILPFGDRALLIEAPTIEAVLALHARLAASRPDGVVDLVPASRTVLVRVDPRALPLEAARAWVVRIGAGEGADAAAHPAREVELGIVYDGPDLAATADLVGTSAEALVRRHADTAWTVAFTGFAPGFGYLVGEGWPFDVPRLDAPRTRVPAGAVGLAGGFCGAYPRATPGGWRLIGTTGAVLFDAGAPDPVLLHPGARVRFRPLPSRAPAPVPAPAPAPESARVHPSGEGAVVTHPLAAQVDPHGLGLGRGPGLGLGLGLGLGAGAALGLGVGAVEVVEPGLRATIQDLGRPGLAGEGIAVSGALDRSALRAANRLVGNREDAAGIEITMGGFRAVARRDLWCALTGGWGPIRLDGRPVDPAAATPWRAGAELHVDWLVRGARAYLALRGGVAAVPFAGSRATDTMAGLGPRPLRRGDVLATADAASGPIPAAEPVMAVLPDDDLDVVVVPGPRADRFTPAARAALFDAVWTVTDHADRVGIRLAGPALARADPAELPSEPMVAGAIQVPPDGPVILMADGPVTGGYPVIAVVTDASLDLLAQARPGSRLRFRHARPGP